MKSGPHDIFLKLTCRHIYRSHINAPPPLKKVGHIALHMSVYRLVSRSRSVCRTILVCLPRLVQPITQEHFAQEASNLV